MCLEKDMDDTVGKECPECGYIHPLERKGGCPLKKAQNMAATERGKKLLKVQDKMQSVTAKRDDWDKILDKIDKYLDRFNNGQ